MIDNKRQNQSPKNNKRYNNKTNIVLFGRQ